MGECLGHEGAVHGVQPGQGGGGGGGEARHPTQLAKYFSMNWSVMPWRNWSRL